MSDTCTVSALHSYPVKSCRGATMNSASLSPQGVEGDRQLMITRDGQLTNQARMAKLATIATRRLGPARIEFEVAGRSLVHDVGADGDEATLDYFGSRATVVDQGDAAAAFLSDALGTDLRLVAMKDSFQRIAPLEELALVDGTQQAHFVDLAPILVTNTASLEDLNGRLEHPVPMDRFRPNIVIDGFEAFEEDGITGLEGDGWQLLRVTHCERCATTCTDQETGARSSEPLATLKSYRHRENGYAGGVLFGAYMAVRGEGTIRVGDRLRVLR